MKILNASRELIFKLGWDTRCRNIDAAQTLESVLLPDSLLLDVGCGEYGLAHFVKAARVIGTDITCPVHHEQGRRFVRASVTSLPFAGLSFPAVASVDVLEHLSSEARDDAVAELLRVGRTCVVITFPCGACARRIDEDFRERLIQAHKTPPEWLREHLQNPYPSLEWALSRIAAEMTKHDRRAKIEISYSEQVRIAQLLRWAASRSSLLYIVLNLLFGLLIPFLPRPGELNGYRVIILIKFQE